MKTAQGIDMSEDMWADGDFEDQVARALIACYETKVRKNHGAAPSDRLNDARLAILRTEGPYIPSNSRLIDGSDKTGFWTFDMLNDRLPKKGLLAFRPSGLVLKEAPNSYLSATYVQQTQSLGKYWKKQQHGTTYEMLHMSAENDGVHGERRFFTVTHQGCVVPCQQEIPSFSRGPSRGEITRTVKHDEQWLKETSIWASMTLQFLADRRHCWTITAQEKAAKAHLGCLREEIKSLLYARSLPMSETGRKRPILHLVESHKRRLRNGIDIDVSAFLRGQRTVNIGGTLFTVNPPPVLSTAVSKSSRERFFSEVAPA